MRKEDKQEPRIIYLHLEVYERGKGKKAKLTIKGIFKDEARPNKLLEYDYGSALNAIEDRKRLGKETSGLEYGLKKMHEEYTKRGLTPPEKRKDKRRRQQAFIMS